jgi:hypothetical protein
MSMRFKLPPGGDVPPAVAARQLGLTLEQFNAKLPEYMARGFPPADPTSGNYPLDTIEIWRHARYPQLHPQGPHLTLASPPRDANEIASERVARMRRG